MIENISHKRTRNYLQQIKGSVFYKLGAIFASFLAIPIMLQYLGIERYGVWSTLLTVSSWILLFDLGIGNGLRNGVADALAKNRSDHASKLSAAGYTLIGIVSFLLWIMTHVAATYVSWQTVFNVSSIYEEELISTVQISAFFVALNLWLGLISALLSAVQKVAMIGLQQLLANVFALLFIIILEKMGNPSLFYLAVSYGLSVFFANIVISVWFFHNYKYLTPKPYISKKSCAPLLSLGLRFFILQISVLVIFTTDKILITQLLGPEYVTEYDVVSKIFSVIAIAYGIISAPLWSAYTDAFSRNDIEWIRSMLSKQLYIFAGAVLAVIGLGLLMRPLLVLWLGSDLGAAGLLIVSVAILSIISVWNNIFAIFVNGIGKINVQIFTAVIGAVLNIPLSIFFVSYVGLSVSGVVFATCVSLLIGSVFIPIQVKQILG